MRFLMLALFVIATKFASSQITATKLVEKDIPATVKYKGKFVSGLHYQDGNGSHMVFVTETGNTEVKNGSQDGFTEAALYAYAYNNDGDAQQLDWKLYDFVAPCPDDVTANFIPAAFTITDLNKDGLAEVWLMYRTGCRGDPSPCETKIIMHEGQKKSAMRGHSRVKYTDHPAKYLGGDYILDDAFKAGPAVFSEYARQLWKNNVTE